MTDITTKILFMKSIYYASGITHQELQPINLLLKQDSKLINSWT